MLGVDHGWSFDFINIAFNTTLFMSIDVKLCGHYRVLYSLRDLLALQKSQKGNKYFAKNTNVISRKGNKNTQKENNMYIYPQSKTTKEKFCAFARKVCYYMGCAVFTWATIYMIIWFLAL